jgi:hypothetical protein
MHSLTSPNGIRGRRTSLIAALRATLLAATLAACSSSTDPGGDSGPPGDPGGDDPPGQQPGGGSSQPGPGVVVGRVVDTRGRPIADAVVWIEPALTTGLARTRTGADGRYAVRGLFTNIPYYAKAWTEVEYNGRQYCLRLGMPNESGFDSFVPLQGEVRDFRWQLTGEIGPYDELYFGGEVRLFGDGSTGDADQIELHLTPVGPLIDGSAGTPLTVTAPANTYLIQDIPPGVYSVTATLIDRLGMVIPLQIGSTYESQGPAARLEFEPSSLGCNNNNGLERSFLYWSRL